MSHEVSQHNNEQNSIALNNAPITGGDKVKTCSHCKRVLGKLEGEGIQCIDCKTLFVLCPNCIKTLHGANCPKCGEFMAVFDDD